MDAIKEIGTEDDEEDKGVAVSEVDLSCCMEDLVDGEADENNSWGCDTAGGGTGAPAGEESPADLVLAPRRTKVSGT